MRINVRGLFRDQHRDEVLKRIDSVVSEIRELREAEERFHAPQVEVKPWTPPALRLPPSMPIDFPRRGSYKNYDAEFEEDEAE